VDALGHFYRISAGAAGEIGNQPFATRKAIFSSEIIDMPLPPIGGIHQSRMVIRQAGTGMNPTIGLACGGQLSSSR
jgi:hypothetical protein